MFDGRLRRRGRAAAAARAWPRAAPRPARSATPRWRRTWPASSPWTRRASATVAATRRFARRQDSWFRKDPRITWVDYDDPDRVDRAVAGHWRPEQDRSGATGPRRSSTGAMTEDYAGRDRLRELLDAVLDEENRTLGDMAGGAYASPYHFSRQLSRDAGEPPVAMRRRVMLERAAWQLAAGRVGDRRGVRGRLRVGRGLQPRVRPGLRAPAERARERPGSHWLPAPNGIHFHPPTSLWVAHHGGSHEPTRRPAGPPRPRRHPRPARPRPSSCPTRTTAPRGPPGTGACAATAPTSRSRRCSSTRCSPRRSGWRRSRATTSRQREADDPAGAARPAREAVAARGSAMRPRHRAARRLGRPDHRRALRPARELRARQRRRPRPHLRRRTAGSWSRQMLRDAGVERRRRRPDQLAAPRTQEEAGMTARSSTPPRRSTASSPTSTTRSTGCSCRTRTRTAPLNYDEFIAGVGAIGDGRARRTSGSCDHMAATGETWAYDMPSLGLHPPRPARASTAPTSGSSGATSAPCTPRWSPPPAARTSGWSAGETWPPQFAEAGLLDELISTIAPVTLGAGRPLFPRQLRPAAGRAWPATRRSSADVRRRRAPRGRIAPIDRLGWRA